MVIFMPGEWWCRDGRGEHPEREGGDAAIAAILVWHGGGTQGPRG